MNARLTFNRARDAIRDRAPSLACLVVSTAFAIALGSTWSPLADRWSALPFAMFGWAGFLAAVASVLVSKRNARVLPGLAVTAWLFVWMTTWSGLAQDLVGGVTLAYIELFAF